jgi:protein-disulfide isomerase
MPSQASDRQAKIQAAAKKGRSGPNRIIIGTVVAVLAIFAVVAAVIVADQGRKAEQSAGGSALPKGASAMGAGLVVNADAPAGVPTLDLWVDYQCPACKSFEDAFGEQVTQLAEQDKVKLVVHVLSFLDDNLGNDSSNRAANAAFCAADQDAFLPFHNATFAGQPAREGDGYTDADLAGFAEQAGLTGAKQTAWKQCYDAREHNQYVESVQTQSSKDGINGTPTVKLDGEVLQLQGLTPESFAAKVEAATR